MLGNCSTHSGGGCGLDFAHYAHFAGCSMGILVLAEIFLRERVDVRTRPLFGAAPDPPADLDIAIGIVRINDRERDRSAGFQVASLHPAFCGIYPNDAVLVVEPDRGDLRRPVRHRRCERGKCLLPLQQIEILVGDSCHVFLLLRVLLLLPKIAAEIVITRSTANSARIEPILSASCAGLTRASIFSRVRWIAGSSPAMTTEIQYEREAL